MGFGEKEKSRSQKSRKSEENVARASIAGLQFAGRKAETL
jgi:hypothetical protein